MDWSFGADHLNDNYLSSTLSFGTFMITIYTPKKDEYSQGKNNKVT